MIRIKTKCPELRESNYHEVQQARKRAITEWENTGKKPRRTGAYKKLKSFLTRVFKEKCGYCESKRSGGQKSIDHFRPTNRLTVNRKIVRGAGYWWLAYEWYNLIPACEECNEWNDKMVRGERKKRGKACEFRVSKCHVLAPSDDPSAWRAELKAEEPLLLSPYEDDPGEHITFDPDTFYPVAITPRGKETIETCGLDRDDLFTAREAAHGRLWKIVMPELFSGILETKDVEPSEEHSAFLNVWLKRLRDSVKS